MARNVHFWRTLKGLGDDERITSILQNTLNEAKDEIVANAPIRTGEYANSIQMEMHKTRTGIAGSVYTTKPKLRNWLEHGTGIYRDDGSGRKTPWRYFDTVTGRFYTTVGMAPRPHWTPTMQIARVKLVERLKRKD